MRRLENAVIMWVFALVLLMAGASWGQINPGGPAVSAVINAEPLVAGGQGVVAVVVDVPMGYHAQSAKPLDESLIAFKVKMGELPAGVKALAPVYPAGEIKEYAQLGKLSVYEGQVVVFIPVMVGAEVAAGTEVKIAGKVMSQMCDDGTCFAPTNVPFEVKTSVAARDAVVTPAKDKDVFKGFDWSVFAKQDGADGAGGGGRGGAGGAGGATTGPSTQSSVAPPLPASSGGGEVIDFLGIQVAANGLAVPMFLAFLVGLIFNVMPCVLPVLPLKAVGFIQAAEHSRAKAVGLGLVFSAGLIAVFGALGLFIFVGGAQWGALFQKAWFVYGMSIVLVLFAASQWGLWTFRLPLGVYTVEPRHDTAVGNFMFGGLTALLSTPCTAPVFPALLLWSAKQGQGVGILLMLVTGVGMAAPYFALSCFPEFARKVPRTGPWSEIIKQFMGFLILGTAVFLASTHLLPPGQQTWPVALVCVAASAFLVVRTKQLMPRPRPLAIASTIAVLLTATSIYAALPERDAPPAAGEKGVAKAVWTPFSQEALAAARGKGQIVLIDFTANWCVNCHYIEKTVYTNDQVLAAIAAKNVVLLKVDITSERAPGSELLTQLNPIGGIPLTAIYFPGKDEPVQLASIYTSETLLKTLGG